MQLTVLERLLLLNVLPRRGSLVDLRIMRETGEALSFSEAELQEIGYTEDGGQARWKPDAPQKEIEIGPRALSVVLREYEALDKKEELDIEHLPLYEKLLALKEEQDG